MWASSNKRARYEEAAPQGKGGSKGGGKVYKCFNCGKDGHCGRDCKEPLTCINCGGGHLSTECREDFKCYNCGGEHMVSECPTPSICDGDMREGISYSGFIKTWDTVKKYGSIQPDGEGGEVILHQKAIASGSVEVGDAVTFTIKFDPTGKIVTVRCIHGTEHSITEADATRGGGNPPAAPRGGGPPPATQMKLNAATLYVQGLPADVTEDEITDLFGTYGTVDSIEQIDGRAAMVKMGSLSEAKDAIEALNDVKINADEDPVKVMFANKAGGPRVVSARR